MGTAERTDADLDTTEHDSVIAHALGGGARIRILSALLGDGDRDLDASEIAERAGVDRATFYRHVDDLRAWGLVEKTREVGNSQMYQLNPESDATETFAALEWALIEHLAEKEDSGEVDDENWPVVGDA